MIKYLYSFNQIFRFELNTENTWLRLYLVRKISLCSCTGSERKKKKKVFLRLAIAVEDKSGIWCIEHNYFA